jgi:hypothetical protein
MVGVWGTGSIHDVGVDIQAAERKIEQYWADQGDKDGPDEGDVMELKGRGMGSGEKGREKVL